MRLFLVLSISVLLSACGQPDAGGQAATPAPYPVALLPPYPLATPQPAYPVEIVDPYPVPLSAEQIAQLQVTNLPPCPAPTATPLATATFPPTWTPAPSGSLPPTPFPTPSPAPFPTPSPAPFPGDFALTLVASPAQGTAPLHVTLSATLVGGPDNSYELSCTGTTWEFGDGQMMNVTSSCGPWSPDALIQRAFTTDHVYEHAGTYQARLKVGSLESNLVTVEVR